MKPKLIPDIYRYCSFNKPRFEFTWESIEYIGDRCSAGTSKEFLSIQRYEVQVGYIIYRIYYCLWTKYFVTCFEICFITIESMVRSETCFDNDFDLLDYGFLGCILKISEPYNWAEEPVSRRLDKNWNIRPKWTWKWT